MFAVKFVENDVFPKRSEDNVTRSNFRECLLNCCFPNLRDYSSTFIRIEREISVRWRSIVRTYLHISISVVMLLDGSRNFAGYVKNIVGLEDISCQLLVGSQQKILRMAFESLRNKFYRVLTELVRIFDRFDKINHRLHLYRLRFLLYHHYHHHRH